MRSCKITKIFAIGTVIFWVIAIFLPYFFDDAKYHYHPDRKFRDEFSISHLETALDIYRLDTGRYPSTAEGLKALVTAPDASENWQGPYFLRGVPKDTWGNPYQYVFPSRHPGWPYDIYSLGADGQSRTQGDDPDDINNWASGQPWRKQYPRSYDTEDIAALTILFLLVGGFIGMMVSLTLCWIHLLSVWWRQHGTG